MRQSLPIALLLTLAAHADGPRPGDPATPRAGDEVVACGRYFHTTAKVVLWTDPGGFDAYRVDKRFGPIEAAGHRDTLVGGRLRSPARYGLRRHGLSTEEVERVRGGGWDLPLLQRVVDQFVIHFDASGTSRRCFQTLQDERGLSVHFLIDLDGTIYQTLDLKEAAHHATKANGRSVGVEIANVGAYDADDPRSPLGRWYGTDDQGRTTLKVPGEGGPTYRPSRDEPVVGTVQGRRLRQYDLTSAQYEALAKLSATLAAIFPKLPLDAPRGADGQVLDCKLKDDLYLGYAGLLGHYHVQANKVDPGPAFRWEKVLAEARKMRVGGQ